MSSLGTKISVIVWLFVLMGFPISTLAAEKILTCSVEKTSQYDPADSFGQQIFIEVWQTPELTDYRWILKIYGKQNHDFNTNGPINPDGTTVSASGEAGYIYYNSIENGLMITQFESELIAAFGFIEQYPNKDAEGGYEYYLVEYRGSCQRTGVEIDQREAMIYQAKAELADLAVAQASPWLQGAGINISPTGLALSIVAYAMDEAQLNSFIGEFTKRGLLERDQSGHFFYLLKWQTGIVSVPVFFEIIGDVTPIP